MLRADKPNRYRLERTGRMRCEARVYLSPRLREALGDDGSLEQLRQAAELPGAVAVLGMPDIHVGFGLPIGGVLAVDPRAGVVSAGAVGMDINCGVRLLRSDLRARDIPREKLERLAREVADRIPAGVGQSTAHRELDARAVEDALRRGARALVERGYGWPEDLEAMESGGRLEGADPAALTPGCRDRQDQLGTVGGGNHFIEVGCVDEIHDADAARAFGLAEGQVTVLIHSGSRGLGHQVCTDYTEEMVERAPGYGVELPARGLAAVPVSSSHGQRYLQAMAAAANYAFANRQLLAHDVREAFGRVLGADPRRLGLHLVYDLAHNLARFEDVDGRRLLVHRKGATRALPAGHPDNPPRYRATGHPVLAPGTMGTASWVLVATPAARETLFSVNHGAGRVMSRKGARQALDVRQFREGLGEVVCLARDPRRLLDEAPQAYKDVDEVVETLAAIGLVRKVARLRPLAVVKGEGGGC